MEFPYHITVKHAINGITFSETDFEGRDAFGVYALITCVLEDVGCKT